MAGLFIKEGFHNTLNVAMNSWGSTALRVGLYKSNHTPAVTDASSYYTDPAHECDFFMYSRQTPSSWTDTSYTGGNEAEWTGAQVTFDSMGGGGTNSVYGWFLYNNNDGVVLYAEKFAGGPYTMGGPGDVLRLTPYIRSYTE